MDPYQPTDEQLIDEYQHGNDQAMTLLYDRHKNNAFNFALRLLENRADAEDVLSEAFCTVVIKKNLYRPEAAFKTWFFTIIRNICLSRLRTRNRASSLWTQNPESGELEELDIADESAHTGELAQNKDLSRLIQHALHQLPREQKEALILREYHQMSYEQIARVLDCSLEKIKILIYRGRNRMQEILAPFLKEGEQP